MQGVFSKEISALPHQTRRPSLHSHGHSLLRPTQPDYRWPDRTCDQGQGVPGHLGPSVRSTSERRGGHHGLEVDCGRHILFKVSLQSTLLGLASHHWMQEDLDYLDPATSQSFPLACGTLKTLDCRPTDTTQPRCTRSLLPMQPGAGDDRPYCSVVFLLRADLVEHPGGTRCRHFPSGQGHPPFLVELMAGALDERQKAGSRLSVRACSVRVVVKRKKKGRCFRNVSCMILQLLAHIKFADQCIDPGTAKLGCLLRE
jgi:hypothetical protein